MDRGKCNEFCLENWFDNDFEPILFNRTYIHRFCINVIRLIQYKIDCSQATYRIIHYRFLFYTKDVCLYTNLSHFAISAVTFRLNYRKLGKTLFCLILNATI